MPPKIYILISIGRVSKSWLRHIICPICGIGYVTCTWCQTLTKEVWRQYCSFIYWFMNYGNNAKVNEINQKILWTVKMKIWLFKTVFFNVYYNSLFMKFLFILIFFTKIQFLRISPRQWIDLREEFFLRRWKLKFEIIFSLICKLVIKQRSLHRSPDRSMLARIRRTKTLLQSGFSQSRKPGWKFKISDRFQIISTGSPVWLF